MMWLVILAGLGLLLAVRPMGFAAMPEEGNEATGQPGNEVEGQEAAPPEQQPIDGPEAGRWRRR